MEKGVMDGGERTIGAVDHKGEGVREEELEETAEEEEQAAAEEVSAVVGVAVRVGAPPAHQLAGEGGEGDDEAGQSSV